MIFTELKDYCYGNRRYLKVLGRWTRLESLDSQCISQRASQKWNNAATKSMWI